MNEVNAGEMTASMGGIMLEDFKESIHLYDIISYIDNPEHVVKLITGVLAVIIFWAVYRFVRFLVKKSTSKKFDPKIVKKITKGIPRVWKVWTGSSAAGLPKVR